MSTPLLETRGVWQRFGGLIANSDVSISVGRGEIVGLIGPDRLRQLFQPITDDLRHPRRMPIGPGCRPDCWEYRHR